MKKPILTSTLIQNKKKYIHFNILVPLKRNTQKSFNFQSFKIEFLCEVQYCFLIIFSKLKILEIFSIMHFAFKFYLKEKEKFWTIYPIAFKMTRIFDNIFNLQNKLFKVKILCLFFLNDLIFLVTFYWRHVQIKLFLRSQTSPTLFAIDQKSTFVHLLYMKKFKTDLLLLTIIYFFSFSYRLSWGFL